MQVKLPDYQFIKCLEERAVIGCVFIALHLVNYLTALNLDCRIALENLLVSYRMNRRLTL